MNYDKRKCLYYGEPASEIPTLYRPKAFKDYTMVNCLLECNAKIVMDECGCLPYHYPDFQKVWDVESSCNVTGIQCLADNYRKCIECTVIAWLNFRVQISINRRFDFNSYISIFS